MTSKTLRLSDGSTVTGEAGVRELPKARLYARLALDKLNALTNDATPPQGACNNWRALYAGIAQLGDDLINHIHLENNVLFPAFEASASPSSQGCGPSGCACSGGGTPQA